VEEVKEVEEVEEVEGGPKTTIGSLVVRPKPERHTIYSSSPFFLSFSYQLSNEGLQTRESIAHCCVHRSIPGPVIPVRS